MSHKKNTENSIITRSNSTKNLILKKEVNVRNRKSSNIFQKSSKTQRSPPQVRDEGNIVKTLNKETGISQKEIVNTRNLIDFTSHTYANLPLNPTNKTILEIKNIDIQSTSEIREIKKIDDKKIDKQDNLTQNQSKNSLLLPQTKSDLNSPIDFFTPKLLNRDSAFFDKSTDDYTDIDGILNEQSLILARTNLQETTETEAGLLSQSNNNIESKILIDPEINMAYQQLKLPLKEILQLVPTFDGKNITAEEYIDKLKEAKNIVNAADERNLVQILKMKLRGEIHKAIKTVQIDNIDELINAIRIIYPNTEDLYTLYGKLRKIVQKTNESVLEYGNKIRIISTDIMELKKLEENITAEQLQIFKTKLEQDVLKSFKNGLKQEILVELGEPDSTHAAMKKAIQIELKLENQKLLRDDKVNILYNIEKLNTKKEAKTFQCQICKDKFHEAMFCVNAGCVYCKNKDHMSNFCTTVKDRIELICNYCSLSGHSIDTCKFNEMQGNHCQYCQNMGHTATQCPIIKKYELCWKCKKKGHDPNTCEKNANADECCELCGNMSHTMRNCPSTVCQKCNEPGHIMKYCQVTRKMIWCTICTAEGHEASDCQTAGIMAMQSRQHAFGGNKINCQICEANTHTAMYCPDRNTNLPIKNNYAINKPNYNNTENKGAYYTHNNSRNTNGYKDKMQQQYFHSRNANFDEKKSLYCEFCRISGHSIRNCRKLQKPETAPNCAYCRKKGHTIENCMALKQVESKVEKFCNLCKSITHSFEECYRRQQNVYEQQNSGNA